MTVAEGKRRASLEDYTSDDLINVIIHLEEQIANYITSKGELEDTLLDLEKDKVAFRELALRALTNY